jgi:hypothetical protein
MSASTLRLARSYLSRLLKGDRMGYWHEPREFVTLAARHGLNAQFYGSFFFLYRFHAVLTLK